MNRSLPAVKRTTKKEIADNKRATEEFERLQKEQVAKNEHTQRVAGIINAWSDEEIFPSKELPGNFSDLVRSAFRHYSSILLHMPDNIWMAIVSVTDNAYTVHQMDMLLQVMNMATAHQLNMDMPEYLDYKKMMEFVNGGVATCLTDNKQRIKDENPFVAATPAQA